MTAKPMHTHDTAIRCSKICSRFGWLGAAFSVDCLAGSVGICMGHGANGSNEL